MAERPKREHFDDVPVVVYAVNYAPTMSRKRRWAARVMPLGAPSQRTDPKRGTPGTRTSRTTCCGDANS